MVGAAGCDGGGNALMAGVNKMFSEGQMQQSGMPPMMMGGMSHIDELHEDWTGEFQAQPMQAPFTGFAPPTEGDWAAEMMALHHQPESGGWVEEFHQEQAAMPQESWAEEFQQAEPQTFGVCGEQEITFDQKVANSTSIGKEEMNRAPQTATPWVNDFANMGLGNNVGGATNWKQEFEQQGGEEDYYSQFKEMMEQSDSYNYLNEQKPRDEYPFSEENPYSSCENPYAEGMKLKLAGSLPQAALAFEAAVKRDAEHFEAWKELGITQADNEKDKAAVAALIHARRFSPHDPAVLMQLGVSFTNEGYRDEATEVFQDWISSHPIHGEFASKALAVSESASGIEDIAAEEMMDYYAKQDRDTQKTIRVFETVLQNAADPDLHAVLGVLRHQVRDYAAAMNHYSSLLKFPEKSEDSKLWNRLGAICANAGQHQQALDAYNRALDINPGFVRVYYNTGITYSQLEDHKSAAQYFLKAIAIQNQGSSGSEETGPGFFNGALDIWDSLRRTFSAMGRQDLYDLTWKVC